MATCEFPKIIDLNVGGTFYSTTLDTLRSDPDSMLCAMFSGRVGVLKDKDSRYFIDRDGNLFRHILNFLRYLDHLLLSLFILNSEGL